MAFTIIREDLARVKADAIVVPANSNLVMHGGAGLEVAKAAGYRRLKWACSRIGGCAVGEAVATPAFKLPAHHIIHAVGPVWRGGGNGEAELLRSAYDNALELAVRLNAHSVALPLLSAGTYGYPVREAFEIAIDAIRDFLENADMDVFLVLFDKRAVTEGSRRFGEIAEFIDDAYAESHVHHNMRARENRPGQSNAMADNAADEAWGREYAEALRVTEPADSRFGGLASAGNVLDYELSADGETGALLRFCPRCGRSIAETARFCAACGQDLSAGKRAGGIPSVGSGRSDRARAAAESRPMPPMPPAPVDEMPKDAPEPRMSASRAAPGFAALAVKRRRPRSEAARAPMEPAAAAKTAEESAPSLSDLLARMDAPFSTMLMQLIDARGLTDAQVYKRANITRQHFSKMRNPTYRPTKKTVVALAVALELPLDDTRELLARAGFALTRSEKFDVIVEFFISRGDFDIFRINEALFAYDQPLLG